MLNCGHSYCEGCLKQLFKPSTKNLTCPSCLVSHNFNSIDDIYTLIKNYSLLSLVETARPKGHNSSMSRGLSKSVSLQLRNKSSGTLERDLEQMEEYKSEGDDDEESLESEDA